MADSISINNTMQTAAKTVAVSHQHYVENCTIMSELKGKPDAMVVAIKERKKAHVAYHMALGFLREATIKANPSLEALHNHPDATKITEDIDRQLNLIINHDGPDQHFDHRIMREDEDWRWE